MENLDANDNKQLYHNSTNENNDMDHLEVSGLYDDDTQQRKSSISFDKIKQISLTYSLQSEEDESLEDESNKDENGKQECHCRRRESSCSNCTLATSEANNASRKPSVIEVKKATTSNEMAINDDHSRSVLGEANVRQPLGVSSVIEQPQQREENVQSSSSPFAGKDHETLARANYTNSPRYPRTNPFTRDNELDYDGTDGGGCGAQAATIMGSSTDAATGATTATKGSGQPSGLPLDARGDQGATVYNGWPTPKEHTRLESKSDHHYNDSDHIPEQLQPLPTSSKLNDEMAARIPHSPRRNQLIGSPSGGRNSNYRTPVGVAGLVEKNYPGKAQMLNGGDNSSLGLRLRQHNDSILSLVVYNQSDANVMVSDDPESYSDESYWGSAAIEMESATIGRHHQHNENIEYSSEEELLEDHNHQLVLQNRDLSTNGGRIRDTNNAIRSMATENDRRPKQTPPPPQQQHQRQQQLPYPIQRPSNRRVDSLSQHDLENRANRRSVGSQYGSKAEPTTRTDNGYHRIDSESMNHLNRSYRQPTSDLERNLQAANYRQHSAPAGSSQIRNGIGNQDFERRSFSPVELDRRVGLDTFTGRVAAGFERIRSTANDDEEALFPHSPRMVQYQGTTRNQLLASEEERINNNSTQDQVNYFVHAVSEEPETVRRSQQNRESISSGYATMVNQAPGQDRQRDTQPVVVDGTAYANANMSHNIYRDYQSRPIGRPKLGGSSVFNQERRHQQQLLNDRHLARDYDATHDEYSLYPSPGSQRRPKYYSNDPMRNPFRDDNHRINIVVSSPQRYVRSKRQLDSAACRAPTFSFLEASSKLRQSEPAQYRPTYAGLARHSADPAWINHRAPIVDHWQQSSPSSICSQSGWSAYGCGYIQESPERTSANHLQRTLQMPGFSTTGGGNPGDKPTQHYQSEHRISSSHDTAHATSFISQRREERDGEPGLGVTEPAKSAGNVAPEAGIPRQYAAGVANIGAVEKQTSNQYERGKDVMDRYASSGYKNADSNSKVKCNAPASIESNDNNMSMKSKVKDQTVSCGESACSIQQSSHTQTEIVPPSGSGCPLFAASRQPMTSVKLRNLLNGEQMVDTLYTKYKHNNRSHGCNEIKCMGSMINPIPVEFKVRQIEETFQHAKDFIDNYYASIKRLDSPAHKSRLEEIETQLKETETYYLKETELIYGAKLAWRNASRCIGRIQWSKLQVFDARFTTNAAEMFEAVCNHIKYATNKGSIRSAITIFPQRLKATKNDWRVWNSQLIGYAGYRDRETSKVIGDPANADFTEICQKLGWKSKGTRFDVLPLVLSANGGPPELFSLPEDLVMRVKIKHPRFKWFEEMQLEWYALPAVANMMLDVGGLQFTAAPFSGWYMVTEIGTRDLGDTSRYNVLEDVAQRMGLNTTSNMTLWKDQALVQLNIAVLDSFQSAGVTIVDHHTASETFMTHLSNEQRLRGGCPADWVWLVPPTGGSTTQVFHQEMINYHLLPNYEYMDPVWKNYDWSVWERQQQEHLEQRKRNSNLAAFANNKPQHLAANSLATMSPKIAGPNGEFSPRKRGFKEIARAVKFTSKLFGKALSRRIKATILFATETGKSERFANKLAQTFSYAFNVHLMSMSDYDLTSLEHEALLLIITSTFGNGDPPENGELFAKHLAAVKLTGDTSPDIESINSVSTNPFFQMISEDHRDSMDAGGSALGDNDGSKPKIGTNLAANNTPDKQEQQTHLSPLSNVRFSVFALGSTAYPHFCAYGRYVDQTLGELGAERILKCALGDELGGQEKAFNEWSNVVFKTACDVFCLTDSIGPIDDRPEIVWSPNDVKFVPVELIGESEKNNNLLVNSNTPNGKANPIPDSPATVNAKRDKSTGVLTGKKTIVRNLMSITNKKIIPFRVTNRVELHQYIPEENLQTICIDLDSDMISTNSTQNGTKQSLVTFEPGDHIAIYPINKLETVQKILDRMHCHTAATVDSASSSFDFDQVYTILVKRENMDLTPATPVAAHGGQNWIAHDRLPITSIREALTRYLDITSPPNQEFLLILSHQASDPEEKKRLQQLAKNFSLYEEWKSKKIPSLLSLFEEFETIKFEPALVTQIPLMKPRFYSVSGTISLTVGVVRFKTLTGDPIEGLCSNYLNSIAIDSSALVYGYIRSAPAFHMPSDKSIPVILISAGTGMAPFRSFWRQRYSDMYGVAPGKPKQLVIGKTQENIGKFSGTFGRIEMYFGCRNSNYILYREELDEMYEYGVLSTVEIAFSRPIDRDVIEEPRNDDTAGVVNGFAAGSEMANDCKFSKVAGIKQARRRMYVQDKLLEHGEDLFKLIMHHGAHIYVCGDVAMADGVYKTLTHIISRTNKLNGTSPGGGTSETGPARSPAADDGETVLMNLRNLNRYHEDIFGAKQMS